MKTFIKLIAILSIFTLTSVFANARPLYLYLVRNNFTVPAHKNIYFHLDPGAPGKIFGKGSYIGPGTIGDNSLVLATSTEPNAKINIVYNRNPDRDFLPFAISELFLVAIIELAMTPYAKTNELQWRSIRFCFFNDGREFIGGAA